MGAHCEAHVEEDPCLPAAEAAGVEFAIDVPDEGHVAIDDLGWRALADKRREPLNLLGVVALDGGLDEREPGQADHGGPAEQGRDPEQKGPDHLVQLGELELRGLVANVAQHAGPLVRLEEGDFNAHVVASRVTYTLTPRTFVSGLLQWNSSSSTFTSNVRFRWEYEPGSDLFVVYSDGRLTDPLSGVPSLLNRSIAVKFTKLFRF